MNLQGSTLWTPEEIERLRELYKTHSRTECAKILGRTEAAVKTKLKKLNITNTAEEMWHKLQNKKPNSGQFKKGNLPHNATPERKCAIRTEVRTKKPYIYYHLELGKWKELHILLWEKQHGPVPPKSVIRFIDGNTFNCSAENLECIPQSLNMLLNSRHNFHPEVAKTFDAINQLKKQINEITEQPRRSKSRAI